MKKLWKSGVALVLVCALMFTQFNTVNVFANLILIPMRKQ